MKIKIIVILIIFLLTLGCAQPKQKDEIDTIKEMQLPEGWELSKVLTEKQCEECYWDENTVVVVIFKNEAILCQGMTMIGPRPVTPEIWITFYKPEDTIMPHYRTKNYKIVYSNIQEFCFNDSQNKEMEQKIEKALEPYIIERFE